MLETDDENPVFRALVDRVGRNYTVETHIVQTEDGFLLRLFHLVGNGTEVSSDGPG